MTMTRPSEQGQRTLKIWTQFVDGLVSTRRRLRPSSLGHQSSTNACRDDMSPPVEGGTQCLSLLLCLKSFVAVAP
jgi:hypothetical protein